MKKIIICLPIALVFSILFAACEIQTKYELLHDSS